MVGSDKVPLPKEGATDEEWAAFYARLDRPEAPEKYEFGAFEGAPEGFSMDPEFEKAFRAEAHKLGLNKKQAAGMWGALQTRAAEQFKATDEGGKTRLAQEGEELKKNGSRPTRIS
jgi:hypothetical protein